MKVNIRTPVTKSKQADNVVTNAHIHVDRAEAETLSLQVFGHNDENSHASDDDDDDEDDDDDDDDNDDANRTNSMTYSSRDSYNWE